MSKQRVSLFGVPTDAFTEKQDVLNEILSLVSTGQGGSILAMNPEKLCRAKKDLKLLTILKRADILLPDGSGVVWCQRKRVPDAQRITGIDTWEDAMSLAAHHGLSVFLLGATAECVSKVAQILKADQKVNIVGYQHGYFGAAEQVKIANQIRSLCPDFVIVALGSPKQEFFIETIAREVPGPVYMGVGGAFDVFSGAVRRAPRFFRRNHLEWLFRLLQQPKRIWRYRILLNFAFLYIGSKTGLINT